MKHIIFIFTLCLLLGVSGKLLAQWEELKPTVPANIYLTCFAANDTFLFIGTSGGYVLRSSDNGKNWLTSKPDAVYPYSISSVDYLSGTLSINTTNGTYRSKDNGDTWVYVKFPLNGPIPETQVQIGNNLYADLFDTSFYGAHIAQSRDSGKTWVPINNGLGVNSYIFAVFDTTLFAKGGSIYRLNNATQTWTLADSGLNNLSIVYFAATKKNIFVSAGEDGIFRSTDNGSHWIPTGFNNKLRVTSLAVFNNTIFAGTTAGNQGVFFSTDEGISWTANDSNFSFFNDELFVYNDYLFLITNELNIWRRPLSEFADVKKQTSTEINELVFHPNYPNPFTSQTTISFSTSKREFVDVKIFDLLGKECAHLFSGELETGDHSYEWNASRLSFGVYTCIIHSADGTIAEQQIIVH